MKAEMDNKKAMLWVIFISCPSMLLSGYAVYKMKDILLVNGVIIDENVYWVVLLIAIWAAMHLSSRRVFKYLFPRDGEEKQ